MLKWIAGITFVGLLGMAIVGAISYDNVAHEGDLSTPQIAVISGTQTYFATVRYPKGSGGNVDLTFTLDGKNTPVSVKPDPITKGKFDIIWNTKTAKNGTHTISLTASYENQVIGEESRKVIIENN